MLKYPILGHIYACLQLMLEGAEDSEEQKKPALKRKKGKKAGEMKKQMEREKRFEEKETVIEVLFGAFNAKCCTWHCCE